MADTDISPVVARLVNRIQSVTDVGAVYGFDVYSHNDLHSLIVTQVGGVDVIRCWWVTGPTMTGRNIVSAHEIERTWTYQIHAVLGVTENGNSIETLRTLGLAVTDAIDADTDLNGTVHRTDPCNWVVRPEHRSIIAGVGVSYMQIVKPAVTLSLPT